MCEEGSTDRVEALEYEISQLKQKKADVLDAFFSKQITKEEMHLVNQRYDGELEDLQRRLEGVRERESITYEEDQLEKDVGRQVADIVNCRADSEVLYKNVLDHMVVHKDRKIEIFLNLLPQKWTFVLENLRKSQNDPPVPAEGSECITRTFFGAPPLRKHALSNSAKMGKDESFPAFPAVRPDAPPSRRSEPSG